MKNRKNKKKNYSKTIKETPGLVGYWPLNEWMTIQDWIIVDDKWHHIAVVVPDNRIPEIYIDGASPKWASFLSVHNRAFTPREIMNEVRTNFKMHYGRSWSGHPLEDVCSCKKEKCGLVGDGTDPACEQHGNTYARTMRQGHFADECPALLWNSND